MKRDLQNVSTAGDGALQFLIVLGGFFISLSILYFLNYIYSTLSRRNKKNITEGFLKAGKAAGMNTNAGMFKTLKPEIENRAKRRTLFRSRLTMRAPEDIGKNEILFNTIAQQVVSSENLLLRIKSTYLLLKGIDRTTIEHRQEKRLFLLCLEMLEPLCAVLVILSHKFLQSSLNSVGSGIENDVAVRALQLEFIKYCFSLIDSASRAEPFTEKSIGRLSEVYLLLSEVFLQSASRGCLYYGFEEDKNISGEIVDNLNGYVQSVDDVEECMFSLIGSFNNIDENIYEPEFRDVEKEQNVAVVISSDVDHYENLNSEKQSIRVLDPGAYLKSVYTPSEKYDTVYRICSDALKSQAIAFRFKDAGTRTNSLRFMVNTFWGAKVSNYVLMSKIWQTEIDELIHFLNNEQQKRRQELKSFITSIGKVKKRRKKSKGTYVTQGTNFTVPQGPSKRTLRLDYPEKPRLNTPGSSTLRQQPTIRSEVDATSSPPPVPMSPKPKRRTPFTDDIENEVETTEAGVFSFSPESRDMNVFASTDTFMTQESQGSKRSKRKRRRKRKTKRTTGDQFAEVEFEMESPDRPNSLRGGGDHEDDNYQGTLRRYQGYQVSSDVKCINVKIITLLALNIVGDSGLPIYSEYISQQKNAFSKVQEDQAKPEKDVFDPVSFSSQARSRVTTLFPTIFENGKLFIILFLFPQVIIFIIFLADINGDVSNFEFFGELLDANDGEQNAVNFAEGFLVSGFYFLGLSGVFLWYDLYELFLKFVPTWGLILPIAKLKALHSISAFIGVFYILVGSIIFANVILNNNLAVISENNENAIVAAILFLSFTPLGILTKTKIYPVFLRLLPNFIISNQYEIFLVKHTTFGTLAFILFAAGLGAEIVPVIIVYSFYLLLKLIRYFQTSETRVHSAEVGNNTYKDYFVAREIDSSFVRLKVFQPENYPKINYGDTVFLTIPKIDYFSHPFLVNSIEKDEETGKPLLIISARVKYLLNENERFLSEGELKSFSPVQLTPAETNNLPEGWFDAVDPSTGVTYYYNPAMGRTTWNKPALTRLVLGKSALFNRKQQPSVNFRQDGKTGLGFGRVSINSFKMFKNPQKTNGSIKVSAKSWTYKLYELAQKSFSGGVDFEYFKIYVSKPKGWNIIPALQAGTAGACVIVSESGIPAAEACIEYFFNRTNKPMSQYFFLMLMVNHLSDVLAIIVRLFELLVVATVKGVLNTDFLDIRYTNFLDKFSLSVYIETREPNGLNSDKSNLSRVLENTISSIIENLDDDDPDYVKEVGILIKDWILEQFRAGEAKPDRFLLRGQQFTEGRTNSAQYSVVYCGTAERVSAINYAVRSLPKEKCKLAKYFIE
eukprot:snap_masked-scaffold_6-processed-gene-10.23-mRNA-1 protein AED:1.00 eAED:1.00 QI:0/-1/0/0/-1/1/1/0/1347